MEFQVRSVDPASRRVGCEFQNLKPREVAALRYLITSYLAGEVIGVGDMLNTLQRENFTKARKQGGGNGGMGFFGRVRAVTLSTAIFVVGVGAFAFILNQMYNLYFVTMPIPAWSASPTSRSPCPARAPCRAFAQRGSRQRRADRHLLGQPAGHAQGQPDRGAAQPGNIEKLFGHQMKGTLISPCDCRVVQQLVADGQYANKGQVISTLAPRDSVASIEVRFPTLLPSWRRAPGELPGRRRRRQPQRAASSTLRRWTATCPRKSACRSSPTSRFDAQYAGRPAEVSIRPRPAAPA